MSLPVYVLIIYTYGMAESSERRARCRQQVFALTPPPHPTNQPTTQATILGTKAAFLKDPLDWYQTFWFPLFSHAYTRCPPNAGHEAIAK